MAFFKFDETQATTGFEMVAEGKYEAIIINTEVGTTQNGAEKLTVDFEIRSDVPQKHQGAKILYNTFTFQHEIAVKIVQSLIKAAGFPNGYEFASLQQMANELLNKHLEITVRHEVDRNDASKKYAKAKFFNVSKVQSPQQQGPVVTVGEQDLPF